MSLEDLRRKIDEADAKIVHLIAERQKIVQEIGKEKQEEGTQIEDREREREVLENVRQIAQEKGLSQQDIESIYQQIVTVSKRRQGIVVAFQGEIGAYSEEAALGFFGPSTQVKPFESLDNVFKAVEQDETQFGVVPTENSLEGSISRTYDLFLDSILKVCGETELRVSHCLIAGQKSRLDLIKRIYSHPQALGQCQAFLRHLDCELIPTYDTAGSVKMIKEKGITDGGAIASARAADIYGMKVIAKEIEDNPNNFTRFFILSKQDSPPSGNDKTSIVFTVKHQSGALYEFLKEFAARNISLTKIESRPTRQKPWEYNFYLDFEGHRDDKASQEALGGLEKISLFVKVLGSYHRAK
ncbi:MAG: prephenate dehydratase [Dehalococcoidales bacterium]|jgi:chorismate mutase/prephenate dehydratase|nr:prephenate dehydratase [Dehalococcoidales bacterium]|tara:strand:+ start:187 stop:1254 length:1068 start_codon:yes stop_codon:yes gene_type:complete